MYIMYRRLYGLVLIACLSAIFVTSCSTANKPSALALVPSSLMEGILYYRGHRNGVAAIAWSPDGTRIASVGMDKTVQMWNAFTGKPLWISCCRFDWVNGIAWSPNGTCVASANTNKTVEIWNASTGAPLATYVGHHREVVTVAWSPDGQHIASGDDDGIVQVWHATQ